jgi:putative DNA-invertase from lambdoid prophage Rac
MIVNAALYARVSTRTQTVDLQLRDMRALAAARGWSAEEYTDLGHSGASQRRPALDRMMADCQAGRVRTVVVWKLDRLGRSLSHVLRLLETLRSWEVGIVSVRDAGLDTTTPTGRALTALIATFAELERDMIRERVQAGVDHARASGIRLGRPPVELTEDQISTARQLLQDGWGTRRIANTLNVKRSTLQRHLEGRP